MNCKPGDLAYVKSGAETPGLSGRFVIVGEPTKTGDLFATTRGLSKFVRAGERGNWDGCWNCTPAIGRDLPWSGVNLLDIAYCVGRPIDDAILRPIRPGETPEESTEAMKRLHDTSVPAKKKEPVVRQFQWEEL